MAQQKFGFLFRMKQLPKPEYQLMKDMMTYYNLEDDPSELFTCLLRLGYEIHKLSDGYVDSGDQWFTDIIAQYKAQPTEDRVYELNTPC